MNPTIGRTSPAPSSSPAIWLVDDNWECLRFLPPDLGAAEFPQAIDALADREMPRKDRLDLDLLRRVATLAEGRYALRVVDYATACEHPSSIFDNWNHAVLFNLSFAGEDTADLPGASLLVDLLNGCRPRAEVALLTGKPDRLEGFFNKISGGDAGTGIKYWLLQYFPVIIKSAETLDFHLSGFVHYFSQRFDDARRRQLARATALAQTLKVPAIPGVDGAHLSNLRELRLWEDRNGPFPLREYFLEGGPEEDGARIESFKALFSCSLNNTYAIHRSVFARILADQGFPLGTRGDDGPSFVLPTRPGSLFIVLLGRFLDALGERPLKLILEISESAASLSLGMRRADIFKDALRTRHGGEVVTAFRDLLGGQSNLLTELEPGLEPVLLPWREARTRRLPGHRPVWMPLIDIGFGEDEVCLSWNERA